MSTRPTRRPRYAPGYQLLPAQRDAIMVPVHMALAAMELGAGTVDHYECLSAFANLSDEMARRMRTAPETGEAIAAGKSSLATTGKRWATSQRFGFSGPDMLAIRLMVTLGDEMMKRANSAIVLAIMRAVEEYINESRQTGTV